MSYPSLTSKEQKVIYEKLSKKLSSFYFERFPLSRRWSENQSIGLSHAENNRQVQTEECVSWRKHYEGGYFIEVLPTFNETLGEFSKEGIASVLIKSPNKKVGFKKNLELYFYRQDGMIEKITAIVSFLNKALQNIPRGKRDGELMELERQPPTSFYFFSSDGQKIKLNGERFFKLMDDTKEAEKVRGIFKNREHYHEYKNPQSKSIREIKKRRNVNHPDGAFRSTR